MSIQTTKTITRANAILRISKIASLIKQKDFYAIDTHCSESDYSTIDLVGRGVGFKFKQLEKWTNKMLEDKMDEPFFRVSLFDNYIVAEI